MMHKKATGITNMKIYVVWQFAYVHGEMGGVFIYLKKGITKVFFSLIDLSLNSTNLP